MILKGDAFFFNITPDVRTFINIEVWYSSRLVPYKQILDDIYSLRGKFLKCIRDNKASHKCEKSLIHKVGTQ